MGLRQISVDQVYSSDGTTTDIAVASTATVYTKAFKLELAEKFALQYQATSPGTVSIKIELEHANVLPTTEGSADDNYVEPDGYSDIVSDVTTETVHIIAVAPVVSRYGRFKLTGQGANHASTTIDLKLIKLEEL